MIDFFREELSLQLPIARQALASMDAASEAPPGELKSALASLHGACLMTSFGPGEKIADALLLIVENYHVSDLSKLESGLNLLERLGEQSESGVDAWWEEHQSELSQFEQAEPEIAEALPVELSLPAEVSKPKPKAPVPKPKKSGNVPVMDLFLADLERQKDVLTRGFLRHTKGDSNEGLFRELMRAAHSIKGAANMVGLDRLVPLAHAMEDRLEQAQSTGSPGVEPGILFETIEILDGLEEMSTVQEANNWLESNAERISELTSVLRGTSTREDSVDSKPFKELQTTSGTGQESRVLRLDATYLDELLGVSGELEVATNWLEPIRSSIRDVKLQQRDLATGFENLRTHLGGHAVDELYQKLTNLMQFTDDKLYKLEVFERRLSQISRRLGDTVVSARMRPLSDLGLKLSRLVHKLEGALNREVRLVMEGEETLVDRDILQRLEPAFAHIISNAIDHGIEDPETRKANGKPSHGTILIKAQHCGGSLEVIIEDDGAGVDPNVLRKKVVERNLIIAEAAKVLTEQELSEFLLLPSFTTRETVSRISGRGFGLDIVREVVLGLGGRLQLALRPGQGLRFAMTLPVSLAVARTLVFRVSGQLFALNLATIEELIRVEPEEIQDRGGSYTVVCGESVVKLAHMSTLLEMHQEPTLPQRGSGYDCIVMRLAQQYYGFLVDEFVGQKELVVQKPPSLLGKIQDVAAASILEDGKVVFLLEADDLLRTMDSHLQGLQRRPGDDSDPAGTLQILIVEDSETVREMQKRMLESEGFSVTAAVDGMDGWNAIRRANYDLVVTDVDMPRMDGLTLVSKIRSDERNSDVPIMVVSYKEREAERQRGLDAGADRYLSKGSFRDGTYLNTILELLKATKVE